MLRTYEMLWFLTVVIWVVSRISFRPLYKGRRFYFLVAYDNAYGFLCQYVNGKSIRMVIGFEDVGSGSGN